MDRKGDTMSSRESVRRVDMHLATAFGFDGAANTFGFYLSVLVHNPCFAATDEQLRRQHSCP